MNEPNPNVPSSGIFVSPDRLSMPSRWVRATNTTSGEKAQSHTIIDKFMAGHEIMPGQSVEIELTEQDFARFEELGRKGHPVKLVSLPRNRAVATEEPPPLGQSAAGGEGASAAGASGASGASAAAPAAAPAASGASGKQR